MSAAKVVEVPAFEVIGISCRTDNAREAAGEGCIGKQWGRLFGEGVLGRIPNRTDQNIVAVYAEYASDKDGEYTHVVGARVGTDAVAPAGMVKVTVPAGTYAVFTSERGPVEQVVPETWMRIWEVPKPEPGGDRAFRADFEVYDERAADPKNAVVDIYIGVR
jgi:predicted transcriptional regulator YdeE